jgi:hypothetical protein
MFPVRITWILRHILLDLNRFNNTHSSLAFRGSYVPRPPHPNYVLVFFDVFSFLCTNIVLWAAAFLVFQLLEHHAVSFEDMLQLSNNSDVPIRWSRGAMYFYSRGDPANLQNREAWTRRKWETSEMWRIYEPATAQKRNHFHRKNPSVVHDWKRVIFLDYLVVVLTAHIM